LGKTYRKYRGEELPEVKLRKKWVDKSCRNHGGCPWCEGNRLYQQNRWELNPEDLNEEVEE